MYLPAQFAEPDLAVQQQLMAQQPLATLVWLSPQGLSAEHIPLVWSAGPGPLGTLFGHVARANPLWQELPADNEVLLIFQGPQHYITPSWYASKRETGKVVPTWNYAVVHAWGRLQVRDDPVWLRRQLTALTDHNEAAFAEPWAVADAPHDYTEKLLAAIVGIEIPISRSQGKWKVSQNQPPANQAGVIAGLQQLGDDAALAMAEAVALRQAE